MPSKLKIMPAEEVCAQLDAMFPHLEYEADRAWLWITTDLAPLHPNKCACRDCAERAEIRKAIGKDGIGFSFASNGHECPSGAISHWGHRCTAPTRFRRRSKGKSENEPASEQAEHNQTSVSDSELLAIIGG